MLLDYPAIPMPVPSQLTNPSTSLVRFRHLVRKLICSDGTSTKLLKLEYIKGVEGHLATNPLSLGGPYTLGKTITYADFVLYQIYHDEREIGGIDLSTAPHLKALVEAMEARPNIAAYFKSDRYYN